MTFDSRQDESTPLASAPAVTAVVLNYRSADGTIRCVESLRRLSAPRPSILIVDNDSRDRSIEALRERLPGVPVIRAPKNLGYGAGNNLGIRSAIEQRAQFVWVLTHDVEVGPDSLRHLLDVMTLDPRVGVAGSIVHAGEQCIVRSLIEPASGYETGHVVVREEDLERLPRPIETDFVDGCAILLRASMIHEIGLFREDWFLYFEEAEYCLRARDGGWGVRIAPLSDVRTRSLAEPRNNRPFFMIRNSILLARLRREYRFRAVARHFSALYLHLRGKKRIQEYAGLARTLLALAAGLLKPLPPVPSLR